MRKTLYLPIQKENDRSFSDQPSNNLQQPSDRKQSSTDIPEQSKIDVSFANKRHARLSSRMTRNQAREHNESDFVDLDQADDPTSFAAHAMLDLKDRSHPTSPALSERIRTEIDN